MAYEKLLRSPDGREFRATTPADANDLVAQGYTVVDEKPRKSTRTTTPTTTTKKETSPSETSET